MREALRQIRRAPGRILASVLALALAAGAIGVLAIPAVSSSSLHGAVARDGLGDVIVGTTPLDAATVARVAAVPGVARAEASVDIGVTIGRNREVRLVGLDLAGQKMDVVHLTDGRVPTGPGEVVASPGTAALGDILTVRAGDAAGPGTPMTVVGHGTTLWWASEPTLFSTLETAQALAPEAGTNRLAILASDDSLDSLRRIGTDVRDVLAADGAAYTSFPQYLPDGSTPIDEDIEQVSTLIGMLGIVAGLVALVLLASTTGTLIAERSREVAIMRALGGRSRLLRRRLRRIALAITAAALVVGLPLGVLVSNLIARMVLEKFVGLTPDIGVDWRVLALTAVFMLLGARVASARAARKVTKQPLAEALRDREGDPYGRRALHRAFAQVRIGGLASRLATRSGAHHPLRTAAVVAQVAAAVGATFLVAGLARSVNEYNTQSRAPWTWESLTIARDAGLPIDADATSGDPSSETAIWTEAETLGWQIDAYGLQPDTRFFHAPLEAGTWPQSGSHELAVSAGFAERQGITVGQQLTVELASGPQDYTVTGLVDDHARTAYVDRDVLSADLGAPGRANIVLSAEQRPALSLPVATTTSTAAQVAESDKAGRDAIMVIFTAIGVVVAGVAALAVTSSMTVSLYHRRHELAALQALGARRRRLRGVVARELLPIGAVGVVLGIAAGALGLRGIIASFESGNGVDIGVVDATAVIPVIAAVTLVALLLLTRAVVRTAVRRPIAVTLRGAA